MRRPISKLKRRRYLKLVKQFCTEDLSKAAGKEFWALVRPKGRVKI